jgi:hypothetical protein
MNPDEPTLEQKIKALEQWVNLINERINNERVPENVRADIRDHHNIDELQQNIRRYRSEYDEKMEIIDNNTRIIDNNMRIIDNNNRIDNDDPELDRQAAVEAAKAAVEAAKAAVAEAMRNLESIEDFIVLFNTTHVDEIDRILTQYIQNGGRRVRKRGQESRRRSSTPRKSSSSRRRRSTKRRTASRKQQKRRRGSRRAH